LASVGTSVASRQAPLPPPVAAVGDPVSEGRERHDHQGDTSVAPHGDGSGVAAGDPQRPAGS
jgi:hypothetical protein